MTSDGRTGIPNLRVSLYHVWDFTWNNYSTVLFRHAHGMTGPKSINLLQIACSLVSLIIAIQMSTDSRAWMRDLAAGKNGNWVQLKWQFWSSVKWGFTILY